jgi:8-oxo-dGTP diphosphatase
MPSTAAESRPLSVAVGVVRDGQGRVLISYRGKGRHQGDRWEFPGGKLDPGESVDAALARELDEELGIAVTAAVPLIDVVHDYGDRRVRLHVREVTEWSGRPLGREGQALRWVAPDALDPDRFPAANRPIIRALDLPPHYVITADAEDPAAWLAALDRVLARGERLIQFRVRLTGAARRSLADEALTRCRRVGARLMINGTSDEVAAIGADGLHLSRRQLARCTGRPLPPPYQVAASCHDPAELRQAALCGVDWAVLSPVRPTTSHPGRTPIGWTTFAEWVAGVDFPVYALGGMAPEDRLTAREHGGQGIAGLSGLWV